MRPIDKFILHVVHSLFPLNEYSEGELKRLMTQFREEADDFNMNISDEQLKAYIQRFDQIKNSPKIQDKDLRRYSLSKLIKLVTASAGVEKPKEEEDRTPDVVFPKPGDPTPGPGEPGHKITIWNGAKQDNCIKYGASQVRPGGSKWCITMPGGSYWGKYRFGQEYGYPTFYLAKNDNLSDSDKLSFVAIQVLQDGNYKFTNRDNRPGMEGPFSWEGLNSRIPWLESVPDVKNILKYINFSKSEKEKNVWKENPMTISQWKKEPFDDKKEYLIVRAGNRNLFSNISNETFVLKYLPQYPQIAAVVAGTKGIIDVEMLMNHLDKFSKQDQLSIAKQIRDKLDLDILEEDLMFDFKKYIVKADKLKLKSDQRIYVTKDDEAIVLLTLGEDVKVGIYTEEDEYPDIKLNQRTSKYLLDYPELDKIPFNLMVKLTTNGVVSKDLIDKVLEKAKTDENSAIIAKEIDGKEIIVDSNSFASYKIENGKITKVPFSDENVQKIFAAEKENTAFQQGVVKAIEKSYSDREDLPPTLDKDAFLSILKATPYDKRTFQSDDGEVITLTPDGESNRTIFLKFTDQYDAPFFAQYDFGRNADGWREGNYNGSMDEGAWRAYFAWMRNENKTYNGEGVMRMWRSNMGIDVKRAWFAANPPFDPTDQYAPATGGNGVQYLVNKADPRNSLKLSDTGKLVKANIPTAAARQLLGQAAAAPAAAEPAAGVPRRGRPAGGGQPRAAAPAAPAAAGDIDVAEVMEEVGLGIAFLRLPRRNPNDLGRLSVTTGRRIPPNGDRGAARRNNQLGGAGSVGRIIAVGDSKIYFIRLANQQIIASINIQPGNRNYLLFGNEQGNVMVPMNSPAELMQVLRQRNLAEVRNYIIREYVANNPQHTNEVREMIKKHIAETQNQ